jgi:hypothetical protein
MYYPRTSCAKTICFGISLHCSERIILTSFKFRGSIWTFLSLPTFGMLIANFGLNSLGPDKPLVEMGHLGPGFERMGFMRLPFALRLACYSRRARAAGAYSWRRILKPLLPILGVICLFRSSIADWADVPTTSMQPTILEGDRIVVNKLAYNLRVPYFGW